ncbi:MAG TPA: cytochrome c peroxidase [Steroidobacteraceae bacterium]|nr:cytochrome c peroxidase [Steroidobacteraceae bacterium]
MAPTLRCSFSLLAVLGLGACTSGGGNDPAPAATDKLSATAALGEKIFEDPSLSASGQVACASCHESDHAFAGDTVVPIGGVGVDVQGFRNAPSLTYLTQNPAFFFDDEGTPTGGFDRDGRAASLAEQARRPFLAAHEMANASVADVVDELSRAAYAAEFRTVFGDQIFATPDAAFERALFALQKYQQEDTAEFAPFTSKYDAFLAGKTQLTDGELRGFVLFNDPRKGNCAACHPSARADGAPPLFTDFTYDNLGVPRNADIRANDAAGYFDLGLCGPDRTDLAQMRELCGAFKVPTLRNVALTAPYFHNGRFATLTEVLRFYVRRDTHPDEWYPIDPATGLAHKFDDLPADLTVNVNTTEPPYDRRPGDLPALTEPEIQDVVAFLQTLTDGFTP